MHTPTRFAKTLLLCTGVAALTITSVVAVSGHRRGTDILHFAVRKSMTAENGSTASGHVDANQNKQGNANNQRLSILLKDLDTSGTYQLLARLDDDTNLTQVTEFQSDSAGRAALLYRKVGSSQGKGGGLGKGKSALPAVLDPLSDIRELAVSLNSTQMVLRADLTAPDKLQYLVKRSLSSGDVDALLQLKATVNTARLRLAVLGLDPTNAYLLALNGSVVESNSADPKGRLMISSSLNPAEILDLHSVALWDAGSNVVISTTLP
jgi:hypothetical protein